MKRIKEISENLDSAYALFPVKSDESRKEQEEKRIEETNRGRKKEEI